MQNTEQGFNPLAITDSDLTGYRRDNQKLFQSTGNLIWDVGPVPGLQARASYSYDFTFWENKSLQKPYYLYDYDRSEEHTSELQSLMRISYAVFCLKKKKTKNQT